MPGCRAASRGLVWSEVFNCIGFDCQWRWYNVVAFSYFLGRLEEIIVRCSASVHSTVRNKGVDDDNVLELESIQEV